MLKNKSIKDRLFRSSPTKRVLSVWKVCSVRLVSTARTASTPPQDREQVAYHKEDEKGQILQEGINERRSIPAGCGDLYSKHRHNDLPMIPFLHLLLYVRSSVSWRPVLAGWRPAGSRLPDRRDFRSYYAERRRSAARRWSQPHSVADYPELYSYDPAYAYEVAVNMHDGSERMYGEKQENVYYYITTLNSHHMPQPCQQVL